MVHSASACICTQNSNLRISNTFDIKSEFTARAVVLTSKSRMYAFAKRAILKNIICEKSTTNLKNSSEQVMIIKILIRLNKANNTNRVYDQS